MQSWSLTETRTVTQMCFHVCVLNELCDAVHRPLLAIESHVHFDLAAEKTRVKLSCNDSSEECADYINANYISVCVPPSRDCPHLHTPQGLIEGSEKAYIATQGPLQSTFAEFWKMVWETNSCVIIMLTREVENGRVSVH